MPYHLWLNTKSLVVFFFFFFNRFRAFLLQFDLEESRTIFIQFANQSIEVCTFHTGIFSNCSDVSAGDYIYYLIYLVYDFMCYFGCQVKNVHHYSSVKYMATLFGIKHDPFIKVMLYKLIILTGKNIHV